MTRASQKTPGRSWLVQSVLAAACVLLGSLAHAQDGVSKTAISLGQSIALTGPSATLGLPFAQGARLYFDRINGAGGVNGRKIELLSIDDAGSPEQTLSNTKKLLG